MRSAGLSLLVALLATAGCGKAEPIRPGQIKLRANPSQVCLADRHPQYLNFDLVMENTASRAVEVKEVRGTVFHGADAVEQRRVAAQAAETLGPNRTVEASSEAMLFNPLIFNSLRPGVRVRYEIHFEGEGVPPAALDVAPQACTTQARLLLPLAGRVLVSDGGDLFSHHRRREYLDQAWKDLGIFDHPDRFALDLVTVDAAGRQFRGSGARNEDFFAWGQPLRAPAEGTVAAVHDAQPDNTVIGSENLWTPVDVGIEPMNGFGNYVLIDHGRGEFSLLAHARRGSVRVRRGARVQAGEVVAQVGNSGSSLGPHLHYELRTGWGFRGIRGLPAYFHDLVVIGTGESGDGRGVALDTGDIVIAR